MADDDDLFETFNKATTYVRSIAGNLESEKLLYFYARFKQNPTLDMTPRHISQDKANGQETYVKAKEGPCNTSRPGFFDFQGKQKWDAWNKLGKKSRINAMLEYIHEITDYDSDWEVKIDSGVVKESDSLRIAVSTMANPDDVITDDQKTVFDWCIEGSNEQVDKFCSQKETDVNQKDDSGMALLHWACDRGHTDIVRLLLQKFQANINITDADGQTPLHYAASCEHIPVVKILLDSGADLSLKDSDSLTALDTTDNPDIRSLLSDR